MGIEGRRDFTGVNSYPFLTQIFPKEAYTKQKPSPNSQGPCIF